MFLHFCSYVLFMTLLLLIGLMDFPFMFANFRIYFLKMSNKMREKKITLLELFQNPIEK